MLKTGILIMFSVALVCMSSQATLGQSSDSDVDEHKVEIGGQVSLLNISTLRGFSITPICVAPPCLSIAGFERTREGAPGFGGRIGYNVTSYLAVEAEVNYFPRERRFDGQEVQLQAGVKLGKRFDKVGIFAKARPGFLNQRISDFRFRPGTGCIAVFPPPSGCFEEFKRRETNAAYDLGGVLELYPNSKALVRFDVGDTIIRSGQRAIVAPSPGSPSGVIVIAPAKTTHNLQGSIGFGFRF
jgi:hypothetical protein